MLKLIKSAMKRGDRREWGERDSRPEVTGLIYSVIGGGKHWG